MRKLYIVLKVQKAELLTWQNFGLHLLKILPVGNTVLPTGNIFKWYFVLGLSCDYWNATVLSKGREGGIRSSQAAHAIHGSSRRVRACHGKPNSLSGFSRQDVSILERILRDVRA